MTADALNFNADANAIELVAYERKVARAAAAPVREEMAALLRRLHLLWPGNDAERAAKLAVTQSFDLSVLAPLAASAATRIDQSVAEVAVSSAARAARQARVTGAPGARTPTPHEVRSVQAEVQKAAKEQTVRAAAMLRDATTLNQAERALSSAGALANRLENAATWHVNQANADAFTQVQRANPVLVRMWRAERDACVHCLAYQGHYCETADDEFPAGLTFAEEPLTNGPVPNPPLHGRCRCELVLVHRDRVEPLSEAYKREAQRSILRGTARPSESESLRVDAAGRLLDSGTNLPASVQRIAKRAVRTGHFS